MTDVKRLLADVRRFITHAETEHECEDQSWSDADSAVSLLTSRLPDYEAAVDALESVLRFVQPEYLSDEGAVDTARAALARLRGPA